MKQEIHRVKTRERGRVWLRFLAIAGLYVFLCWLDKDDRTKEVFHTVSGMLIMTFLFWSDPPKITSHTTVYYYPSRWQKLAAAWKRWRQA